MRIAAGNTPIIFFFHLPTGNKADNQLKLLSHLTTFSYEYYRKESWNY
jgi:hypothetical protein